MEEQAFLAAQAATLSHYGVDFEQRFVPAPVVSGRAQVLTCGTGPDAVVLNGIGTPAAMWAPLLARLHGLRLHAVDLPGYGLTDTAPGIARDLRATARAFIGQVLDGLALDRPAIDVGRATAVQEIDATGLIVAPGFIHLHSHATPEGVAAAVNMLTQGVTTEILGPDGGGPWDLDAAFDAFSAGGLALNIGAFVGFNRVWSEVMGPDDRRASPAEIEAMQDLVITGLEGGAWGVSAGLDYKPAYFATTTEVIDVLRPAGARGAGRWNTIFTNHDRLTPESGFSSRVGMEETVEIGEATGLRPVITHMKIQGREQGTGPGVIQWLAETESAGTPVAADVYPYLAGQTGLSALIIPGWAQAGGRDAMLERFADSSLRSQIVEEAEEAMEARFDGPSGVYLLSMGRELTDVMSELGVRAGEAVAVT